ncbi:monooxygenase 1-like isoform X1 [Apium graveolens]|uniref:monooxygenase 1-like isoform X1 n=1 Tax=Apium graveolens TaxID=4045 RepID=UPI003D797A36
MGGAEGEVKQEEIVIVGAGICGLATALAFHRKGIRCIVLERAESLRSSGVAITILPNGWRALHQLNVASILRKTACPILGTKDIWLDKNKQKDMPFISGEARCLKRSDLIDTLYHALPPDVVKFGHQIISVKLDPQTSYPMVQLQDGSFIAAKVLIGCDGAKSTVADFLELKPTKLFDLCSIRGLTNYPNCHPFAHDSVRMRRNNVSVGRIPIDSKLVYWFVAHPWMQADNIASLDTELIRQYTFNLVKGFPKDVVEMVKNSDLDSLCSTRIRYRAPWDLLLGSFRKGTVTVAGDAMHVMGPYLGQGGSVGLEDAIVLARNLAKTMSSTPTDPTNVKEAIDHYVKERRMRIVQLSTQTYLTGLLIAESTSLLVKFACIVLMVILFRKASGQTKYDCGTL